MNDGCILRPGGKHHIVSVSRTDVLVAVALGRGIQADSRFRQPKRDRVLGAVEVGDHHGLTHDRARRAGFLLAGVLLWISAEDEAFAFLGQVAVAVAIHVQDIAVEDNPGAALRFRTEDEQAVLGRLGLIGRLLGDGAVDLGQIATPGGYRGADHEQGGKEREHSHRFLLPMEVVGLRTIPACITPNRYRRAPSPPNDCVHLPGRLQGTFGGALPSRYRFLLDAGRGFAPRATKNSANSLWPRLIASLKAFRGGMSSTKNG